MATYPLLGLLDASIAPQLESFIREFETAWHGGEPPLLDRYLPKADEPAEMPARVRVLEELIKLDMEFRWRSLKRATPVSCYRVEQYFERHPELKNLAHGPLDLVVEEYRVRQRWGDRPDHEEFVRRFLHESDSLVARLKQIDSELFSEFSNRPSLANKPDLTSELKSGASIDASASVMPVIDGYQISGEIGEGGMGVVYSARDLAFDREVAIKTLRCHQDDDLNARQRFIVEAKITGQLQHPGIPAVHELGMLLDGRPFLAMKRVKGQTLRELLQQRSDPNQERGRFISIFEQICQALGYAHDQHVIHRDLKPSNVMVGANGEVQVMDWGLAKVCELESSIPCEQSDHAPKNAVGNGPDAPKEGSGRASQIGSALDTPVVPGSDTRTGTVLGTFAYMPPEQASGKNRLLNPRSDVFGLGAVLCEVITGRPPYFGASIEEMHSQAMRGQLADALASLVNSGAEPELVALCKRCLAFDPEERPGNGGIVAGEVARIREAAEARARQAEMERAAALIREGEQRKRRRQFTIAACLVVSILIAGVIGTSIGMLSASSEAYEKNEALQAVSKEITEKNLALEREKDANKKEREATSTALQARHDLAMAYRASRQIDKALPLLETTLSMRTAELGPNHPDTLASLHAMAAAYEAIEELGKAVPLYEQALATMKVKLGPSHPATLTNMIDLAFAYVAIKQPKMGVPLFADYVAIRRAQGGARDLRLAGEMALFAHDLARWEQYASAEPIFRECLEIRSSVDPDGWLTYNTKSILGRALAGQKKYEDAEPFLREGFEGMKIRENTIPPEGLVRVTEALERLVRLYEATGKAAEADHFGKELAQRKAVVKEAKQ